MAFERVSDNLHRLNDNIRDFAKSSAEYYKLDLFNKTMKGATAAVKGVAIAFFMIFALLFLSIALSVLLSTWLDIPSIGFFIVGGIYLLIVFYLIFFGGAVINRIMLSTASKKFFNESEKESENTTQEFTSRTNIRPEDNLTEEEDERI